MIVLLPPSETKRAGGDGPPLRLDGLATPQLTPLRERLVDELIDLAAHPDRCRRALGISAGQDAEIARNAALRTSPTLPALQRYTGVLYDALDVESLRAAEATRARARLAVGSALFGHIPNLVTIRGDRYRDALTVIDTIERVRALQPEILLTGHFEPIVGTELIDGELARLRDAVRWVHDQTVAGMNAGKDVTTLMAEVTLPDHLAVGEGYGKVSWDVRAIWENYSGWFHHRSTTELYPVRPDAVSGDLVELAGADALTGRARVHLDDGDPLTAIQLAEIVTGADPGNEAARAVLREAHETLLAASVNFWERAWLDSQIRRYS